MSVVDDNPFSLQRPILIVLVLVLASAARKRKNVPKNGIFSKV